MDIPLPNYDCQLPKAIFEYKEGLNANILKMFVEQNIGMQNKQISIVYSSKWFHLYSDISIYF